MVQMAFVALLALVASAHAGVTVPSDLPNGVYDVTYNENGNAVHNLVARSAAVDTPATGPLRKRDSGPFCGQAILPSNNILQAQNALGIACDANGEGFVSGWTRGSPGIRYAKFDTVVAYVCNYSQASQHCTSSEINSDFAVVAETCPGTAGWYSHYDSWQKNYGYDDVANTLCV